MWYHQKRFPEAPWLTSNAVRILSDWLKPGDIGIEWGCGRSTIWLAPRIAQLISIEYDKKWYDQVNKYLADKGIENITLQYVPLAESNSSPNHQEYIGIAKNLPIKSLDFALVDGRLWQISPSLNSAG